MKIKEGFVLRKLANEYIVVGEGLAQVNFNKMIVLNETASFLWENLEGKEFSLDDMVALLLETYDVSEETAREDAQILVDKLVENAVVE
ncbi:MAG: PqqD family protein [Bacteroidales bacterium]|nr:PqqD family protein [Bacteroidales bacterium]